jgi:UDP-GlcNAc3NAcA epimerase
MKIIPIVGIRSQFIKLAGLQLAVERWNSDPQNEQIDVFAINTGQHYDVALSEQYTSEYNLAFRADLTGKHADQSPDFMLGSMISLLCRELRRHSDADCVIVFGDANSTLAGAIAAKQTGHRLTHVESGLRSGDLSQPEERNRIVADHIADLCLSSSRIDDDNLKKEGISNSIFTGDIIRDLVVSVVADHPQIVSRTGLVTLHREENTVNSELILMTLRTMAEAMDSVVFIAHPRVNSLLEKFRADGNKLPANVTLTSSLPHEQLLRLVARSEVIVTDSGALQREAFYIGRQILVRQDVPFWPSITRAGFHRRIGEHIEDLRSGIAWAKEAIVVNSPPAVDDFGNGDAGSLILDAIHSRFVSGFTS